MKITEFSLRNPLVVAALTGAVIAFGIVAYLSMGIGVFPNVSFPEVLIITSDPGADPATIETQITKPIEDAVASLANIDTITSTSDEGVSSVAVQFTTAANENLVPVDVERVVNTVRSQLPVEADAPTIVKPEVSLIPVITIGVSGPQPLGEINRVAKDQIARALNAVPGVQSVRVSGGQDREIQVKIDPTRLESHGLGLNQVQLALQAEQLQLPAGQLTDQAKDLNVRVNGLVSSPDQLGLITIATTANGPVYLKDVGTIVDGFKTVNAINRVDGVPAVTISLTKLSTANGIAVSQGVRNVMATLQPTLPQGMRLGVVTDSSTYAQQSFNTIQRTLIEAVLFTGLILLAFLHTWRSTLIVLVSIPTSLFTTFGLMSVLGMDLNLFSMLAVTLSVGILVDDSIVVLENIYRHLGLGDPPVLAAINGRSEIGLAALTITMVDVAVYVPIALITGVAGDFIRPFALVVAAATLTSLVVSFTLTPLLASRLVTRGSATQVGSGPLAVFGRWWNRGFDAIAHGYERLLRLVLTGHLVPLGRVRVGGRWRVVCQWRDRRRHFPERRSEPDQRAADHAAGDHHLGHQRGRREDGTAAAEHARSELGVLEYRQRLERLRRGRWQFGGPGRVARPDHRADPQRGAGRRRISPDTGSAHPPGPPRRQPSQRVRLWRRRRAADLGRRARTRPRHAEPPGRPGHGRDEGRARRRRRQQRQSEDPAGAGAQYRPRSRG